mmetsp:Transcript_144496/g.277183  ORF Transcript_144496/g.277183 Transcript_144496/m.277183 type:complete len:273 (+) Transcript_144496:1174-1992(+)
MRISRPVHNFLLYDLCKATQIDLSEQSQYVRGSHLLILEHLSGIEGLQDVVLAVRTSQDQLCNESRCPILHACFLIRQFDKLLIDLATSSAGIHLQLVEDHPNAEASDLRWHDPINARCNALFLRLLALCEEVMLEIRHYTRDHTHHSSNLRAETLLSGLERLVLCNFQQAQQAVTHPADLVNILCQQLARVESLFCTLRAKDSDIQGRGHYIQEFGGQVAREQRLVLHQRHDGHDRLGLAHHSNCHRAADLHGRDMDQSPDDSQQSRNHVY